MRIYPHFVDSGVPFQAVMFLEKLRQTLKQLFEEKKDRDLLTADELAARMECAPSMVGYLLKGERGLDDDWLLKFCAALEISPTELLRKAFGDAVFMGIVHTPPRDALPADVVIKSIRIIKQSVTELEEQIRKSALEKAEEKKTVRPQKTGTS